MFSSSGAQEYERRFLVAASRLGVDIVNGMVVGNSVWDMLAGCRARALGVGFLLGGYGQEELDWRAVDQDGNILDILV
jgi:phosphoglycolate phosphatase-like HAD superfamily hydrolase